MGLPCLAYLPEAPTLAFGENEAMEVVVRQAVVEDAPDLAALHLRTALIAYASIFPTESKPPTLEAMIFDWERRLQGLHGPNSRGFVALADGKPAGMVMAGADLDHHEIGHIARLYVDVPCWACGIGTLLHNEALSYLQQVPYHRVSLWVLEGNLRARRWYERLGWSCTGERKTASGTSGVEDVRYVKNL